jgi:predicted patatin/cPLA2 family phospholipase
LEWGWFMAADLRSDRVMVHYADAYQKLYNRPPKDLRALDNEWVIVNGARIRVTELENITRQLLQEYHQGLEQKRSIVARLVKWFKG